MADRMDAWYDESAVCVIAVSGQGDPLDLAEHEAQALVGKLEAAIARAQEETGDEKTALRRSWAVTLRHLAASRFYLPQLLLNPQSVQAEQQLNEYLHSNELGLALHEAESLGVEENAPPSFWRELFFAASNMGLAAEAKRFSARSDA